MKTQKEKPAIGQTIWFKVFLTILIFVPPISQLSYQSTNSSAVIASVLSHPLAVTIPLLLPLAKLLLLAVVVIPFIGHKNSAALLIGYYGALLLISGVFENMAQTSHYGFVWLIGNTLVQSISAVFCFCTIAKHKSKIDLSCLNIKRIWVVIPMLLAFFMPYSLDTQNVVHPAFTLAIFTNEAGVTYCMITPVILGVMILFSKDIDKPLLSVLSYTGLLFGLLNMITWFALQNQNWWMGVLHLPLLILSFYGLLLAHKEKAQPIQKPL